MSNQVTFDPAVGGDGSTVSDGRDALTGLDAGGWRQRFVPALAQIVAIATWVKNRALDMVGYANAASASALAASTDADTAAAKATDAGNSATAAAISAGAAANAAGAAVTATSATNLTIGTGVQALVTQANKGFQVNSFVLISSTANATKWMHGQIAAYDSATGNMSVTVLAVNGTGTLASWNVALSGPQGPAATAGVQLGQAYYMASIGR